MIFNIDCSTLLQSMKKQHSEQLFAATIASPPQWGTSARATSQLGEEATIVEYAAHLSELFSEVLDLTVPGCAVAQHCGCMRRGRLWLCNPGYGQTDAIYG